MSVSQLKQLRANSTAARRACRTLETDKWPIQIPYYPRRKRTSGRVVRREASVDRVHSAKWPIEDRQPLPAPTATWPIGIDHLTETAKWPIQIPTSVETDKWPIQNRRSGHRHQTAKRPSGQVAEWARWWCPKSVLPMQRGQGAHAVVPHHIVLMTARPKIPGCRGERSGDERRTKRFNLSLEFNWLTTWSTSCLPILKILLRMYRQVGRKP